MPIILRFFYFGRLEKSQLREQVPFVKLENKPKQISNRNKKNTHTHTHLAPGGIKPNHNNLPPLLIQHSLISSKGMHRSQIRRSFRCRRGGGRCPRVISSGRAAYVAAASTPVGPIDISGTGVAFNESFHSTLKVGETGLRR